ncbi:MAG: 16S rRNA (cytosine(1402)-N(4))-methyltransferase RsmH [Cyclonatronaceae bacterium]
MQSFASYHTPVLPDTSLHYLLTDPAGVYIDGTLGAGGHSAGLLRRLAPGAKLFGIDQDDDALAVATRRISDARFEAVKGNFGFMETLIHPRYHGKAAGVLLDLGVSSYQINEPARGFSFQEEGPLDMRMGTLSPLTAAQVVNTYSFERLRTIIYTYGEDRFAPAIARRIIDRRPLQTTFDLKRAVEEVVHGPDRVKSLARVFQAVRIEVNQELEALRGVLPQVVRLLKPGGRVVVLSYHSLEDRIVKQFFRAGNDSGRPEKDFYGNVLRPLEPVFNKPVKATPAEIQQNPRARSVRLRAATRTDQPQQGAS